MNSELAKLRLAVEAADAGAVEAVARLGVDLTAPLDSGRRSAAQIAAAQWDTATLRVLAANGVDLTALDRLGHNLIHTGAAAVNRNGRRDADFDAMLAYLRAAGLNVNEPELITRFTPLHLAIVSGAHENVVRILHRHGADPHAEDGARNTALHLAIRQCNLAAARALVRLGVNPFAPLDNGRTLYHALACAPDVRETPDGAVACHKNALRRTAAYIARIGVDAADPGGSGDAALVLAARNASWQVMAVLLEQGVYPDAPGVDGRTALACACQWWCAEAVRALLAAGADPHARTADGRTPVHHAALPRRAHSPHGAGEVLDMLIACGVDLDARDNTGASALTLAAGSVPEFVAALLLRGARADSGEDVTAFLAAARGWCAASMRLLWAAGADPLRIDPAGRNALHMACAAAEAWKGRETAFRETLACALEAGVDLQAADASGDTPLHLAGTTLCAPLVRTLLDAGADACAVNGVGLNCADAVRARVDGGAAARGKSECLALLDAAVARSRITTAILQ